MKNRLTVFLLLIFSIIHAFAADDVKFTASAPATVIVDKPFQLVYTVNAAAKDLRAPELENFEILAGPFSSRSSSYQIINGKSTSSLTLSFTYTLLPSKEGNFTIPSASITVDKEKYSSNGLSIKVLPPDQEDESSNAKSPAAGDSNSSSQSISNDKIFIRTSVSKTNVFEQEPILVTYKLYALVDVVGMNNMKFPDFNGFMKQELTQDQNKQKSFENFNGKNYGTVVLYEILLYPQRSGDILIDKASFDAVIRIQNRTQVRSIFDDFFDSYVNVNKSLVAPSSRIKVTPLPANKPASFSGTVGKLSLNSSISDTKIKVDEAVTLKLAVSGSGNLKLLKNPEIKFPDGLEVYDPKINSNFKASASGMTGTRTVEYVIIPRHSGNYVIPASELSYFDIGDKTYKTLRTSEYTIHVEKSDVSESAVMGTYVTKEDVKQLGNDIRYIETSNFPLSKVTENILGSLTAWLLYLVPLFIAIILFFVLQKHSVENSDILYVKNKKANKLARKRLKQAQKLLSEGKKDQFYDEILKTIWSYLSDKLSVSAAMLTKEKVAAELSERSVDSELIDSLLELLNTCEYARYAPNTGQHEMGHLYSDTMNAISKLETLMK